MVAGVKLIAANWKMNGRLAHVENFAKSLSRDLQERPVKAEMLVCPPFPYLEACRRAFHDMPVKLGAQDCSAQADGAYTGEVSAPMLKDMGCDYVIIGHSERRAYHHETDALIAEKIGRAHAAGLNVVFCVGEKDPDIKDAERHDILHIQLHNGLPSGATAANTVIAYEPVWAIGSGRTPTTAQITSTHTAIRSIFPQRLHGARVLYGGSVNGGNAEAILGASLDAASYHTILRAA